MSFPAAIVPAAMFESVRVSVGTASVLFHTTAPLVTAGEQWTAVEQITAVEQRSELVGQVKDPVEQADVRKRHR